MKKILSTALAGTLALGLCACGTKPTTPTTEAPTEPTTVESSVDSTTFGIEETELTVAAEGEGWHYGMYYGKPWYVDDKTPEQIADIAYGYVTNAPEIGQDCSSYYSSFACDNGAERSAHAWNEYVNTYEGKGKPVTEASFCYGYINDVDKTKTSIRSFSIENLWLNEDLTYAGSAYEHEGTNYSYKESKTTLSLVIFVPTEEQALAIYNTYLEKYGAEFGYDASVKPSLLELPAGFGQLVDRALTPEWNYVAAIQHETYETDYYRITFVNRV